MTIEREEENQNTAFKKINIVLLKRILLQYFIQYCGILDKIMEQKEG